ncbi:Ig-like domain repeat protein, partial [Nocardioides sp.]|uniref:Ig-like domain repeat protein n=1 Tax=Nocardioides sp. TaxID=35761 RepID=UPI002EDA8254
FTPVAGDLIGVGSDTIQTTLHLLAERGWNAQTPAPAYRIASFAALGGGNITLPSGSIPRPNGSGAGKALLYGAGNNTDIDFARSSSGPSTKEVQAGLQSIPFALDTLVMAVSNSTPSHAPDTLTQAQIVSIYKGEVTDWSQIGGQAGTIAPKIPQPGSGTRGFFTDQLKAMNGGVAVDFGANVAEVQEHDDAPIKNDPNAIAPFSKGRAGLLGTTLRLEKGWSADRALYNVVRGADLARADIKSVFGADGFVCSTAARPLIEQSGFEQLATADHGGVCGEPTQTATTNFTVNKQVVTTTTLAASSPKAKTAKLVATVTGSTPPSGSVDFFEGATQVANDVPMVSGAATTTLTGVAPGSHTYTAVFTPAEGSVFEPSQDESTVKVLTSATITESFPASVAAGAKAKGTVTVSAVGATATGKVSIMQGAKVLKAGTLKGGKATFTLKLAKGKNKLKAVYAGNAKVAGATKSFTIKQK